MVDITGSGLFPRQGGKYTKRKDIFNRWLPIDKYTKYIEPFVGGGNILMEAPYKKIMIASDTDTTVINIFKDLQKADLNTFINFDFIPNKKVWISYKNKLDEKQLDPTERFIMTMYIKKFSFNGMGQGYNPDSRSKGHTYKTLKENIKAYKTLKHVKFYKKSYTVIIPKYDSDSSFFYCDPPYYETDTTDYETGTIDHLELFNILDNIKGYFLLSYNDTPYIRKLYKNYHITSFKNLQSLTGFGGSTKVVTDLLISNYQ